LHFLKTNYLWFSCPLKTTWRCLKLEIKCAYLNEFEETFCSTLRESEQLLNCWHDSNMQLEHGMSLCCRILFHETGVTAINIKLNNVHNKGFNGVCLLNHMIYKVICYWAFHGMWKSKIRSCWGKSKHFY